MDTEDKGRFITNYMLVTRLEAVVFGRCLITISSSLSMLVFASRRSLAAACLARSSLTRAMRSSRVNDDLLFRDGRATASKISSSSSRLWKMLESGRSPFSAFRASAGLPSTAVVPPKLGVGDKGDFIPLGGRERRSMAVCLSKLFVSADLPASHSSSKPLISAPIDSYWERSVASRSPESVRSTSALDSSLITCILACKARIPWERELSFRYCERRFSLLGEAVGNGDGGMTSPGFN